MRQLSRIIMAMLAMSGRVRHHRGRVAGLYHYNPALAGTGGSYRTVMRFFHTYIPWATVFWVFFRRQRKLFII
jgi:hypothetical protein